MSLSTSTSLTPSNFSAINNCMTFKSSYNKDQLFNFLSNSCMEKPKFTSIKFNKQTQDEVSSIRDNFFKSKPFISSNNGVNSMSQSVSKDQSRLKFDNSLRQTNLNESYPRVLPQWIKFDKQVLKFTSYFVEHVTESNVETYRIRPSTIYYYLDDETIQVFESKIENSGLPQGTIIRRQRIKINNKITNEEAVEYLTYKDLLIGNNVKIFGKVFRICDCDAFTKTFFQNKGIELKEFERVPEYVNPKEEMLRKIDISENLKNISEYKEFCEVKLGGGHPNRILKNFLDNDRKVLSFDIIWDDYEQDKEIKQYKMNYYLAENMVEVREIKENNSGKDNFPYLLKKSFLPKKPNFTYCPGLNTKEVELYKPEDLILGNYVNIFGRPCYISDCDDFTKRWYKENLGLELKPLKRKTDPPSKAIHNIPPHNGFGSEEDSLLTVFYLNPSVAVKRIVDQFKKDKHILRFNGRIINQNQNEAERKFVFSVFVADDTLQIFEEAGKNSGRFSAKFMDRRRVKNPITSNYYSEKDFFVGANIYINKYIFMLYECDEKTRKYMKNNYEVFRDSNIERILKRIQKISCLFENKSDFCIQLLHSIDPYNKGNVQEEDIVNGLKRFELHLSSQEQETLFDFLKPIKNDGLYNMEDFYEIINAM